MAVPRLAFDQQLGTTAGVHGNTDSSPSPAPLLTPSYGGGVWFTNSGELKGQEDQSALHSTLKTKNFWARNMVQQVKALAT